MAEPGGVTPPPPKNQPFQPHHFQVDTRSSGGGGGAGGGGDNWAHSAPNQHEDIQVRFYVNIDFWRGFSSSSAFSQCSIQLTTTGGDLFTTSPILTSPIT